MLRVRSLTSIAIAAAVSGQHCGGRKEVGAVCTTCSFNHA